MGKNDKLMRFLRLADKVALSSKDPSTKVGARAIVSSGLSKMVIKSVNKKKLSEKDQQNYSRVKELFNETGVGLIEIDSAEIKNGFYWDNQKIEPNDYTEQEKKHFKLKEKYFNFLEILENYADNFSPYAKQKSASMILNADTLAPLENAFGVYAPPFKIQYITEEMVRDKEDWFLESEKNAIFNSVRDKFDGSTAVVCWCPCIKCSLSLVAIGIKKVVTRSIELNKEADLRWKESFDKSIKLFNSVGVSFVSLAIPRPVAGQS